MKDNKSAYNASIYDSHIVNVLPYYREYTAQIIDLVDAAGKKNIKWLDSGCGTGTLTMNVLAHRSDVQFTLCDPSSKMLKEAEEKLAGQGINFLNVSSQELPFEDEFDVVTAVQCHHYLTVDERRDAEAKCYKALKDNGIFVMFENIKMSTDESDDITLKRWVNFLKEHGNSQEDVEMQLSRRGTEVLPITIEKHIELLREVGFKSVNLLWASYLQAGIWAIK